MSLLDQFSKRISHFSAELSKTSKRAKQIGWFRTILFFCIIYLLYLLLSEKETGYLIPIASLTLIFGFLILQHQKVTTKASLLQALIAINEEEVHRIDQKFDTKRNGEKYIDDTHDYASDLDLFGNNSLFLHLNRTEFPEGEAALAQALISPLEINTCIARQQAIQTLVSQLDWRQEWQAALHVSKPKNDAESLKIDFPQAPANWQLILAIALTIVGFGLMVSWIFFELPFQLFLGVLPVNLLALGMYQRALTKFGFDSSAFSKKLNGYIQSIKLIKHLDVNKAELLKKAQDKLGPEAENAWKELSQLIYILDSRANVLYWLINPLIFIDVILQSRLANWYHSYHEKLPIWIETVHEMEVLISMAGYVHLHPGFTYPQLEINSSKFKASALAHPLILDHQVIANDFEIGNENISLVTGSNMSGKSTFLRTIGIAHVMAWIGLPVKSESLTLGRFDLFTSMRIADDLSANTSSFYAELKRISKLLDELTDNDIPILYFLDEILKGTNSHDRHKGAAGLMQKLIQTNSYGFISTHDLELAVEFEGHPAIKNYSFNSSLIDDKLHFSYQISNTICQTANASKLMANMGIIPVDTESQQMTH